MGLFRSKQPLTTADPSLLARFVGDNKEAAKAIADSQDALFGVLQSEEEVLVVTLHSGSAVYLTDRRLLEFWKGKPSTELPLENIQRLWIGQLLDQFSVNVEAPDLLTGITFREVDVAREFTTIFDDAMGDNAERVLATDEFYSSLLSSHGFPLTSHNVFALTERFGAMFMIDAMTVIPQVASKEAAEEFKALHPRPISGDLKAWVTEIYRDLRNFNDGVLRREEANLPGKVRGMLLEDGSMLNGDPRQPLPTLADWSK